MKSDAEFWIPFAVVVVLTPVLLIGVPLYYAWAATIIWGWFAVPIFNAPSLTVMQAWGLILLITLFRPKFQTNTNSKTGQMAAWVNLAAVPLVSLGFGYAIKHWWV